MKFAMIVGSLLAVGAMPAQAQVMAPAEYVKVAGASDLYETQSSQVVLETTQNPAVRAFATMMIADHAKSTADVKAAAARSKLKASPPMLMPLQSELIDELKAEAGPARDAAYIAQQKASHNQALAVQQAYAIGGTAKPLKTVAGGIVPVVQHHISMLKTM